MKEDALKAALDKLEAEAMALNENENFKIEDILNIVSEINKILNDLVNPKERPEMRAYQRKYIGQFGHIQTLITQNLKKHSIDIRSENLAPVMEKAKENSTLFEKYLELVKLADEERKKLSAPVEGYAKNPKIREAVTNKAKKSDAVAQEAKRMLSYSEIDTLLSQIEVHIEQINTPPHTRSDIILIQIAQKIKQVNNAVKAIEQKGKTHQFPSEDILYNMFLEARSTVLEQKPEILASGREKDKPRTPTDQELSSGAPKTFAEMFETNIVKCDQFVPPNETFIKKQALDIDHVSLQKLLSNPKIANAIDPNLGIPKLAATALHLLSFLYDPPKIVQTKTEKMVIDKFINELISKGIDFGFLQKVLNDEAFGNQLSSSVASLSNRDATLIDLLSSSSSESYIYSPNSNKTPTEDEKDLISAFLKKNGTQISHIKSILTHNNLIKILKDDKYAQKENPETGNTRLVDIGLALLGTPYNPPSVPSETENQVMNKFFSEISAGYDIPRGLEIGLKFLSLKDSGHLTGFKKTVMQQLVSNLKNKDDFLKNTKQLLGYELDDSGISETDIINLRSLALQKPEDFTKFHAACDKLNINHQHFSEKTTPDDKDKISLAEYATLFKMTKMLPTLEAINKYGGFDNDPEMKKFFEAAKKADMQLKAMGVEYKPSMKAAHFFQKLAKPFIKLQEKISHTAPIAIRTVQYTAGALKNTISSSQPLQFLKQKKEQLFTPKEDKKASQTPNTEPQKPKK